MAHRRNAASHQGAFKPLPKGNPEDHTPALQEMWAEIQRLRLDLSRIDASRLAPKFANLDLDGVTAGGYFECGFEPYTIVCFGNFANAAAFTMSVGMAVRDENVDGEIAQFMTCGRATGAGAWRASASSGFCGILSDDNSSIDTFITVTSWDQNGFTYTHNGGGAIANVRGYVTGR